MTRMNLASSAPDTFGRAIAASALFISLLTLAWQWTKHVLDGGRVRVYLNPAVLQPTLSTYAVNTGGKLGGALSSERGISVENIELAELIVENPGREAVTIHQPVLAIRDHGRHRFAVTPRMIDFPSAGGGSATNRHVVRLEPYDRVTFLLDVWSAVPAFASRVKGPEMVIRGGVSVAGRKRPSESSKRLSWKISRTSWTFRSDLPEISPHTVMWRELFRAESRNEDLEDVEQEVIRSMKPLLFRAVLHFDSFPAREDLSLFFGEVGNFTEGEMSTVDILVQRMHAALEKQSCYLSKWRKESPELAGD